MANKKEKLIGDVKEIRAGLKEINNAHQPAINQSLDGIVKQLEKYLLVKQTKLENYVEKLRKMTNDEVANGLLDTVLSQLSDIGTAYSKILKLQGQTKTPSELEDTEFTLRIISEIFQLILKLQMIEEILNTHIGDPQLSD